LSAVAGSTTRSLMSKPASAAIACTTSATALVSEVLLTRKSTANGVLTPASLSSALALATSRLGIGNFS